HILGKSYTRLKNFELARKYLNEAIKYSTESGRLYSLQNNYFQLAILDSAQSDWKKAYSDYKMYFRFHDSIYNQENTQKLTQQKMQYLFDKKRETDSLAFANDRAIAAVKLHEQRLMTYGGFGVSILTAILLFFAYINYKKQKLA